MKNVNQGLRISYKHQDQNPKIWVLCVKFPPKLEKKSLNLHAVEVIKWN